MISDCSKFVFFKNRKVRTPVELLITDGELQHLQIEMKMRGIQHWELRDLKINEPYVKKNTPISTTNISNIKNSESTNDTTLAKLMKEE